MIFLTMPQAIRVIGLASMLLSANAHAIALGAMQVYSTQLQPLQLQVELIEVEGILPNSMAARMAGPAQFLAAGLPYLDWYADLDVKIVNSAGGYAVAVEGQQAVDQAQLDFIFEVDYLGGRLLAEYAVNLAAPSVPQESNQLVNEVAIVKAQVLEAEAVLEAATTPLLDAEQSLTIAAPVAAIPVFLRVKPGQTLWNIAVNNSPKDISPWQTLMALYRFNPAAYKDGDIRQVMANSRLRLPTQDELILLNANQAKAAYKVLVPPPSPQVKPNQPLPDKKAVEKPKPNSELAEQAVANQLLKDQADKLKGLSGQSEALQAKVKGLQADYSRAMSQQELLSKTSQNLAQGVAEQEQDIKSLNTQRNNLETNMLTLDQKFEATQVILNQTEEALTNAQQALAATQEELTLAAQVKLPDEIDRLMAQALVLGKKWAFLLVPILLLVGFIWWLIGRQKSPLLRSQPAPKVTDQESVGLDPLADHDNKPSAKVANLRSGAKKMQGGMPERSFIEELLQQQEQDEAQLMRQGFKSQIQDDELHLSTDVQAMLARQKQSGNQANEPLDYLSHDEEMNTKLDLALSYRDMGDVPQAQALLQQVLHQGSAEQQTQARVLLSSINKV